MSKGVLISSTLVLAGISAYIMLVISENPFAFTNILLLPIILATFNSFFGFLSLYRKFFHPRILVWFSMFVLLSNIIDIVYIIFLPGNFSNGGEAIVLFLMTQPPFYVLVLLLTVGSTIALWVKRTMPIQEIIEF